jgi:predicted peptidase
MQVTMAIHSYVLKTAKRSPFMATSSRKTLANFLILCFAVSALAVHAENLPQDLRIEGHFSKDFIKHAEVDFRVYLPEDYEQSEQPWPLVLWLHGDGGQASRGGWNEILSYGPPSLLEQGRQFPFIVLTPQLWGEVHWDPDTLHTLLLETIRKYNVDENRVVVMGYSRGGFGAWELACSYPETFAAVVPISARPMTAIERVKDMGVWIFHGELDTGVPLGGALNMHQELEVLGADVRLTVFPGGGHDAVNPAMATDELWDWLLAQKR